MLAEAVRPIEVLLVEDDEGDVLMTREALEEGKVLNRLTVVGDGVEAVEYLRRRPLRRRPPAPTSSCSTSTCPGATAARCWRRSRPTRTSGASRSWC